MNKSDENKSFLVVIIINSTKLLWFVTRKTSCTPAVIINLNVHVVSIIVYILWIYPSNSG